MRLLSIALLLFTSGCFYLPPENTRHLSQVEIIVADFTIEFLDVPEPCQDISRIGIYQATTQQEFFEASNGKCSRTTPGECPDENAVYLGGLTLYDVASDTWDTVIVLESNVTEDGRVYSLGPEMFAHELHHHFNDCMWGNEGHGHENHWRGDALEDFIWSLIETGELPFFLPLVL